MILLHTPYTWKRSCMECTVYKWCIINTLPLPNVYARLGGEDKGFNSIVYLKTMRKKLEAFNNPSHHKILPPPYFFHNPSSSPLPPLCLRHLSFNPKPIPPPPLGPFSNFHLHSPPYPLLNLFFRLKTPSQIFLFTANFKS